MYIIYTMNQNEQNILELNLKNQKLTFEMVKFMIQEFPETKELMKKVMYEVLDVEELEKITTKKSIKKTKKKKNNDLIIVDDDK